MIYGYARVSTQGQAKEGNSLEIQEKELRDSGAEIIIKEAYTGTKKERPEFDKLLMEIKRGDTLVATKLDRIARNAIEGEQIITDLQKKGVTIKILNMGTIDDSPIGKVTMQVFFAFAEFERNMIVERTQAGRIASGNLGGRPRKYSKKQMEHAMELLQNNSYTQVEDMTGISKATLARERKRIRQN